MLYNNKESKNLNFNSESFSLLECRTTSESADPNQPCVFPFKYGDFLFTKCTDYGASGFWCPTKTHDGFSRANSNNWGLCDDRCPKQERGNSDILWLLLKILNMNYI